MLTVTILYARQILNRHVEVVERCLGLLLLGTRNCRVLEGVLALSSSMIDYGNTCNA